MKRILIAAALLPVTFLTACAVYPHGDGQGRYGRHEQRGDYRYNEGDRHGNYDGDRDQRRGQGDYCPSGQTKKGRC